MRGPDPGKCEFTLRGRCEGLWLPGEACGWSEEWTPFAAAWRKDLGPEVRRSAGGWGAVACGNGKGQTEFPELRGAGGGSWTSSRGRSLLGQVLEAGAPEQTPRGAQGPSPGGVSGVRATWGVGRGERDPSGPQARGSSEAGWAATTRPWRPRGWAGEARLPVPPSVAPWRGTSLFKSPAFLVPHRTQGLRTNPLVSVTFPKRRRAGHCVSLDLAPVCSPRPQVPPWAAAGAALPEAGARAGHAAWGLGVGGETLRLQRSGARTRGAAHGRVPGPHPAPRRVYSAPGPAPCPAPFPPTALARPAPDQLRPRPPSAWSPRRSERGRRSRCTAAEAQHPAAQTVRPAEHGAEVRAARCRGRAGAAGAHGRGTGARAVP